MKTHSLRRQSEFLKIKNTGNRKSLNKWLLINYCKNDKNYLRYGLTVSSKVGTAVIRNRLKRWVRQYFQQKIRSGFDLAYDFNVIFKPMQKDFYKRLEFKDVELSLDNFFSKI